MENDQLRDLNQQLKELLETYNNETKRLRLDFEHREAQFKAREADLKTALVAQEKKMVEKVLEGIEYKQQGYTNPGFDFVGKMDKDFEELRQKRREIAEQINNPDAEKVSDPSINRFQNPVAPPVDQTQNIKPATPVAKVSTPQNVEISQSKLPSFVQPKPSSSLPLSTKPESLPPATNKPQTPVVTKPAQVPTPVPTTKPKTLADEIDNDFLDDFEDL